MISPHKYVNEFKWSARVQSFFSLANITTFDQLCKMPEREMLKYRNFGKISLTEIRLKLKQLGLTAHKLHPLSALTPRQQDVLIDLMIHLADAPSKRLMGAIEEVYRKATYGGTVPWRHFRSILKNLMDKQIPDEMAKAPNGYNFCWKTNQEEADRLRGKL